MKNLYAVEYKREGKWVYCSAERSLRHARFIADNLRKNITDCQATRVTRYGKHK
jgi:hypothetical protein